MKVLHVVNAASTGGAQTLIENLARVQSKDIESTILVILGEDHLSNRFSDVARVIHLGMSPRTLRLDKVVHAIRSLTSDGSADVLHSHLLQADLASLVANRRRRVGHVSTVHTTGMSTSDPLKSRLIGRMVGRASTRIDAVVACSKSAYGYMDAMHYTHDNRAVITNGVPVVSELSPFRSGNRSKHFVSLSRWHPMKDHANLFSALSVVLTRHPDAKLTCAGTGMTSSNEELIALIDACGVGSAVNLLGPVDDVALLLRSATGSIISSSYGEALPMAGLESISVGTPLIGTVVGEISDLVVHDRLLARPSDFQSLAASMIFLLEMDDNQYAKIRVDSHETALREYDVRLTAQRYHSLYKKIAK